MLELLWLIPALPAAGFVLLVLLNRRLGRAGAAWIGAGSVGLSAVVALLVCGSFIVSPPAGDAYHQVLWTWMDVAGFAPTIGFYLDAVSVTWVPFYTLWLLRTLEPWDEAPPRRPWRRPRRPWSGAT